MLFKTSNGSMATCPPRPRCKVNRMSLQNTCITRLLDLHVLFAPLFFDGLFRKRVSLLVGPIVTDLENDAADGGDRSDDKRNDVT